LSHGLSRPKVKEVSLAQFGQIDLPVGKGLLLGKVKLNMPKLIGGSWINACLESAI